jgi:CRISPR/Cas system-associated exonuclease Cas4 (RecB family)
VIPTVRELLLAHDAQRPRSQQVEMGMSSLGSCRRQAGYHAQGYAPDPEFVDVGIQAVLGTACHEAAARAARALIPGAAAEDLEVSFAGLKGHPDLWVDGTVVDLKTKGYSLQVENVRQNGPAQRDLWQISAYAAGLILAGYPVHTLRLDYIARDSGDEHIHEQPFSTEVVQLAMAWLADVRETMAEMLPRDYRPDSATCRSCRFFRRCWQAEPPSDDRHVLFLDDPDAAAWAERLEDARARLKAAERDEADARGALDHLRSVRVPGEKEWIEVPGLEKVIRFSVRKGRQTPDMAQIALAYKRADPDARPPVKYGEPTIGVALIKRKPEDS